MLLQWLRRGPARREICAGVRCLPLVLLLVGGCAVKPQPVPDTRALQPPASPMAAIVRLSEAVRQHGWRDHLQVTRANEPVLRCRYADTRDPQAVKDTVRRKGGFRVSAVVQCDGGASFVVDHLDREYSSTSAQVVVRFASIWSAMSLVPVEAPEVFEAKAAQYRGLAEQPLLPESAREYKVRAEAAVREGRLLDAVEAYDRGLQVAPTWPQGHFNVALLLGELKTYGLAVEEMQRYLLLVPDAANARQAQDKIYEWRGKLEQPLPQ